MSCSPILSVMGSAPIKGESAHRMHNFDFSPKNIVPTKNERQIKVPTVTPSEFQLGDTAADLQGRGL